MTARLPDLVPLAPPELLRAAERILANPTYAVQRVSLNETYTFALAATALAEIAVLAARQLAGAATPADLVRLREHLVSLGVLPPGLPPSPTQEPIDGQA